ncbi:nuclear transport factor 2 family protein [Streptomyces sp. NPDC007162]|uniref:nuclear transport factor 2 family protein n=1 Tax=Streptomyces sp. NPDC007162 TaxID=3156917 RepID=UPI0033F49B8E
MSTENKELVVHFYNELFAKGNLDVIDKYVGDEYIQHNPWAPNGTEALRGFVTGFRSRYPELQYEVARVIAEDDLVLLHSHAVGEPGTKGQVVVDIFRVRDGKIVEHWDVIQDVPDSTVSGNDLHSTLSAPAGQSSDASGAASKQVVSALLDALLTDRDVSAWDRYAADPYYAHNPKNLNGVAAAKEAFSSAFAALPDLRMDVKRIIADGEYVAVHHTFQVNADDRGAAVVDIFRVQDGKIVEHWDVFQPVPEKSANDNTMF